MIENTVDTKKLYIEIQFGDFRYQTIHLRS